MQQRRRRPGARFEVRADDTRESEQAGRAAGEHDAAECDVMDPDDAWLEHIQGGGMNTPNCRASFVAAYECAYERAFSSTSQDTGEVVPDAV